MKNLKRALSLALASVMVLGMMVVGASAVEFKDAEDIVNVDAVNTMAALGVLKGKDTGAFDPEGIVTRAEMAKIICVMLSGGKEPNLGTSAAAYPDTGSHWANSYIAYCANLGIVAGDNHGKFNPDATVTGTEAAKMLLVALGYDSDVFMFTGAAWAINVNTQASKAKLYDEVDASADAGLSRDNAAQMAFNALEAFIMEKTYDKVQSNGQISYNYSLSDKVTFLNEYFDGKTFVGTYTGNKDNEAANNDGEIAVYGKLDTAEDKSANYATAYFPSDMGIENIGEEVKVIFKDGKGGSANRPDKNDTIYGVFNTGMTEVLNAEQSKVENQKSVDAKITVDGKDYNTTTSVTVYTNYVKTGASKAANNGNSGTNSALTTFLKAQTANTIKFVMDDNGKIFAAYLTEYNVGKITGLTSTKITISGVGAIEIADNDVYEDVAKDDVVVYTRYYNDTDRTKAYFTVTKAETVEGELTGYKLDSGNYVNVVVDGTTYKVDGPATSLTGSLSDDAVTAPDSGNIGDTVRLYMVRGMVGGIQSLESTGGNFAVITDKDTTGTLGSSINGWRVTVKYTDGKEETLPIHKDSVSTGTTAIQATDLVAGNLVEYSVAGGKLKIKEVETPNTLTLSADANAAKALVWDKDSRTMTYADGTRAVAASNSTIFVQVGTDFYAYDLRGLGNINNAITGGTAVKASAMLNSDGQVRVAFAQIGKKPTGSTSETLYGIVSNVVGAVKVNDDDYVRYTVYAGGEDNVTINVSGTSVTLSKGDIITFDEASDECYDTTDVVTLTSDGGFAVAVKNYNESTRLLSYYLGTQYNATIKAFEGFKDASHTPANLDVPNSITVDKDVKIVYVNADANKGGDEIGVGGFDVTTGYANVLVHTNADDLVDVIVVETSGEASLGGAEFATGAPVVYDVGAPTLTVTGTAAGTYPAADFTIAANKATGVDNEVVTVTVTYTGNEDDANDTFAFALTGTGLDTIANPSNKTGTTAIKTATACTFQINASDVSSLVVTLTATAVT